MKKLHIGISFKIMKTSMIKTINEDEFIDIWDSEINECVKLNRRADLGIRITVDDIPPDKFSFKANVHINNLRSGYMVKQIFDMIWKKYEDGSFIEDSYEIIEDLDGDVYEVRAKPYKESNE